MLSLSSKISLFLTLTVALNHKASGNCFTLDEGTAFHMGLSKKDLNDTMREMVESMLTLKNGNRKLPEAELRRRLEQSQRILWAHVKGRHSAAEIKRVESMAASFNEFQKGMITLLRFTMQDIGRLTLQENIAKGLAPPIDRSPGVRLGVSQEYIQYANVSGGKKTSTIPDMDPVLRLLKRAGFDTIHVEPHYPFGADQGYSVKNEKTTNPDLAPKGQDANQLFRELWMRHPEINKWIDFVPSHVDRGHSVVQRALTGDKVAQERIVSIRESDLVSAERLTSDSGEIMVRYRTRQGDQVIVTERGLEFSGMREIHLVKRDGRYYHHSFTPQQFDLVCQHEMNMLMYFEFINHWMTQGMYGIRADAVPFWFKPWGTAGKHEAEARFINEFLLDYARGINPKAEWIPEVVAGNELANPYAGRTVKVGNRSTGSGATTVNNFELGALFVHGVAMSNAQYLKRYLYGRRKNLSLPDGVNENIVLTKHDQHDLGFIPDGARQQYHRHLWKVGGGVSADGWSGGGRVIDIMRGDRNRLGTLLELAAGMPGSINIHQGDLLGVRSNWLYHWEQAGFRLNNMRENNLLKPGEFEHLRDLLKRQLNWERRRKREVPEQFHPDLNKLVDIRDVHRGPVSAELVKQALNNANQYYNRTKNILPTKARSAALSSQNRERLIEPTNSSAITDNQVLSFIREAKRPDGTTERVLVIGNLSNTNLNLNYAVTTSNQPIELKGARPQMSGNGGDLSVSVPANTCYWIRL